MIEDLLRLSDGQLDSLAQAIEAKRLNLPFSGSSLTRVLPGVPGDALASSLNAIAASSALSEAGISLLVRGVLQDRNLRSAMAAEIELVATGPDVIGLLHRETSVVVHDLFAHAETSVLIAGYAVYQGQRVFKALSDRMLVRPKLVVRMFLDIRRAPGDTTASAEIVRGFVARFMQDDWPHGSRPPEIYFDTRSLEQLSAARSSLHAKCIVVDGKTALVSSANFTEAAQNRNIELGLLTRRADIAHQIVQFFDQLVESKTLQRVV